MRDGDYTLPLAEIAALGLPVVNFGPYGAGAHQHGERLLMSNRSRRCHSCCSKRLSG